MAARNSIKFRVTDGLKKALMFTLHRLRKVRHPWNLRNDTNRARKQVGLLHDFANSISR